jgi:vacuolar protein sorting-associated protein VTA1
MSSDWSFPPVPPELKSLAPYFQRAQELRVKDPVMSYWCSYLHICPWYSSGLTQRVGTYYAAQQGIALRAQSKDAKPFLFQILSILEQVCALASIHTAG